MSRALGRYELLRPLARGGMGEVYLARRRAAGVEKWLVVKRMRPERAGDSRFLDLFMREAKLTMSLAHQNIVPVFDFGRIDDQVFLAMERVEGKDLGSSLQKAAAGLPPLLAAFVTAECLQALDYAHRRKGPDGAELGIVHRDVTPRNVLLSWSGEVKLTDFGIAALAGDAASKGAGTPAYMAPEQARGESLDVRADIYAVGLVLREALTGVRARRGNDRETVFDVAQKGELEPWPDGVAPALRAIADKATSLDREARYPDARAMLEELDAFIVADRAATKGDPPARQLAAWLANVWQDTRDDESNMDAQIEAGVLVSFLDDGPLDVVGTGTERSALATAGESAAPAAPADKPATTDKRPTTEAAAPPADDKPAPPPIVEATPAARRNPRSLGLILGVLAVAGIGSIVWFARREGVRAQLTTSTAAVPDAAALRIESAPADAAVTLAETAPTDAAMAVDAAVIAEKPTRPTTTVVRPHPREERPDAGVATEAVVAPTVATRKVTINSKPTWSNWTVDGGPAHSGVETIELAPGKHTIHFTGNPYFKADKTVTIEVPDRDGFTHVETLEELRP